MVDTWATVGSCAQIGANVHLAGGVGIGGVLEPANAVPVVIEDGAFIGSRCMVVEGARVGKGSVLGAGTILNPSIPVIDAQTGEEVSRGYVPDHCVAVVGASRRREFPGGEFFLPCVLIIKRLDEGERHDKVALNASTARPRGRDVSRLDDALALVASRLGERQRSAPRASTSKRPCAPTRCSRSSGSATTSWRARPGTTPRGCWSRGTSTPCPVIASIARDRGGPCCVGLGACDMKGSLAVMLELAVQPVHRAGGGHVGLLRA